VRTHISIYIENATIMAKKLYIGGLPWDITGKELREVFEEFGEIIEAKVVTDRYTKRCRGFGFITFKEDDDAMKAIEEGDGGELDGKTIKVREAKEKKTRDRGRDSSGERGR